MRAFLKRDFDALPPGEQETLLASESEKLREEINVFREGGRTDYATELESKFDELVRGRAEGTLNDRLNGIGES